MVSVEEIIKRYRRTMQGSKIVTSVYIPKQIFEFSRKNKVRLSDLTILGYLYYTGKLEKFDIHRNMILRAIFLKQILNEKIYIIPLETLNKIIVFIDNPNLVSVLRDYYNQAMYNNLDFVIISQKEFTEIMQILRENPKIFSIINIEKEIKEL